MQAQRRRAPSEVTNPQVLDCLAVYLLTHCPHEARALHLTCRAAAFAIRAAVQAFNLRGKAVDLAAVHHNFAALTQIELRQCCVDSSVCSHPVSWRLPPFCLAAMHA